MFLKKEQFLIYKKQGSVERKVVDLNTTWALFNMHTAQNSSQFSDFQLNLFYNV